MSVRALSKRQRLAGVMCQLGGTWLLERLPRRRCLIVLNYHRIGDPAEDDGDPGVFSATAPAFDEQVAYLKRSFHVCSLAEALEYVERRRLPAGAHVLITFDDGYLDNYRSAYPILRSHGVSGVFFLATSLVGSSVRPWWDAIASMVKASRSRSLRLSYPEPLTIDLDGESLPRVIRRLLALYKAPATTEPRRLLDELARATGVAVDGEGSRRFLDWSEAAEMIAGGMEIGAHTHRHELLSRQTAAQQRDDVATCKRLLEARLRVKVDALAYPVGSRTSFTVETKQALRDTGYRAGLSFYGGINLPGALDAYDIKRMSVELCDDQPILRLRASSASILGRPLI